MIVGMKRIHQKNAKVYRPFLGEPYKNVALTIAAELNKSAMIEFDDLGVERHALYELWKRVFPKVPFPASADAMRTPYHKDPGI